MNLSKRISAIEATLNPPDGAWIALIDVDGVVELSHVKYGKLRLPSREAFETWYRGNIIEDGRIKVFIVDVVNCKGDPPKEL